jgi:cell wall-associated NlpC family hydrolase
MCAAELEGPSLPRRIRFLLPFLVLLGGLAGRLPAAGATVDHGDQIEAARVAQAREAHREARVVTFARRLLGVPYVYGGESPSGFDCSGFTRYVFAHFGVSLPHYTYGQYDLGHSVARASLQPGDLVFFDGVGHVGLYIGRGRFIHAPHSGTRVSVDSLSGWYGGTYDGARRIF